MIYIESESWKAEEGYETVLASIESWIQSQEKAPKFKDKELVSFSHSITSDGNHGWYDSTRVIRSSILQLPFWGVFSNQSS